MKKSHKKQPAEKEHQILHGALELTLGFVAAAILAFVLINLFREEVFNAIMEITGL